MPVSRSWSRAWTAATRAAQHGTFVSADLNYRSKVEPDKDRARRINQSLAPYLGFLVGSRLSSRVVAQVGHVHHAAHGLALGDEGHVAEIGGAELVDLTVQTVGDSEDLLVDDNVLDGHGQIIGDFLRQNRSSQM